MIRFANMGSWASWSTPPTSKAAIPTWWREDGRFHIEKTATIPPEPATKDQLPPLLQGFGAVPPLVTDIDLSMDDKFLYVALPGRRDAAVRRHRP